MTTTSSTLRLLAELAAPSPLDRVFPPGQCDPVAGDRWVAEWQRIQVRNQDPRRGR